MRVLLVSNTAWNIFNFRMKLVQGLRDEAGLDVEAVATPDGFERELECAGLLLLIYQVSKLSLMPHTHTRRCVVLCLSSNAM